MKKNNFEVIRGGINTTFQDSGRNNLYHIGIPFSGAMDNRNYLISNALVNNQKNSAVIEFAYQGPLLKFNGNKITIAVTGNVNFDIIKKNLKIESGNCYQTYDLFDGDQIDLKSTDKSVYGYLSVSGEFETELFGKSCSTNTKAKIGSNGGEKINERDKIVISNVNENIRNRKVIYINNKIEQIRVIKGTNFDYFSEEGKKLFFNSQFRVSKLTDRMGMRLHGKKIENIVDTNIRSEGLIKGVVQVPEDGNPIIMLSDHGTIGGYPKIGVVISADYDKLVQATPGSNIKFKEVNLSDAENLFKLYNFETQNILNQIT